MNFHEITIKNCNEKGFKLTSDLLATNDFFKINEVYTMSAIEYAKIKCKEQRALCLAHVETKKQSPDEFYYNGIEIEPDSILNCPEPKLD